MTPLDLTIKPVTAERWHDLEQLFGPRGACGGCWCMFWKLSHATYQAQLGEPNRIMQKAIIESGETPGLLAYVGAEPVGWVAVALRQYYPRLAKSRILKPVDDLPVWSIVCFFVARRYRRQGVTSALIEAAVDYAGQHGAKIVEAYPVETRESNTPPPFIYTGVASAFFNAGFVEAARRSPTRPVMRRVIT